MTCVQDYVVPIFYEKIKNEEKIIMTDNLVVVEFEDVVDEGVHLLERICRHLLEKIANMFVYYIHEEVFKHWTIEAEHRSEQSDRADLCVGNDWDSDELTYQKQLHVAVSQVQSK
jgi:hypothetical protein